MDSSEASALDIDAAADVRPAISVIVDKEPVKVTGIVASSGSVGDNAVGVGVAPGAAVIIPPEADAADAAAAAAAAALDAEAAEEEDAIAAASVAGGCV